MKQAVNVIVSTGILGLILWWADTQAVLEQLRGASLGWLAAAVVALTLVTVLMAKRWQTLARSFDIDIHFPRALGEYYLSQLVNLVLPGGVAGDVTRAVRLRHSADLTRAAQSVAADRILGQGVMFGVLGIALAVALCLPGGIGWPAVTWLALVAALGALSLVSLLARKNSATGRFVRLTMRLFTQIRLNLLSLAIVGLLIFAFYACASATGTDIPSSGWLTLIPLILSAMLIPLSVGGWGWREGAAAAMFPLIGATPSAGIATGIAYGVVMMIAALPGLYVAWRSTVALTFTPQN